MELKHLSMVSLFIAMLLSFDLMIVQSNFYKNIEAGYEFIYKTINYARGITEYYSVKVVETVPGAERILKLEVTYENGTSKVRVHDVALEHMINMYIPTLMDYDITKFIAEGRTALTLPIRISGLNEPINKSLPYSFIAIDLKPIEYDVTLDLNTSGLRTKIKTIKCASSIDPYSLTIYIDASYGILVKLVATGKVDNNVTHIVTLEFSNLFKETVEVSKAGRDINAKLIKYIAVLVAVTIIASIVYKLSKID